jgi:hypothetical protein
MQIAAIKRETGNHEDARPLYFHRHGSNRDLVLTEVLAIVTGRSLRGMATHELVRPLDNVD